MKLPLLSAIIVLLALSSPGVVLLDDTWLDGTRTDQNLPAESAWFASSGSSVTATTNGMNIAMSSTAILGVTYFATNDTSPVALAVGDTLKASITLTLSGVATSVSSAGFRIGLFNFADSTLSPKWVTADLGSNSGLGSGVAGYALFQTMVTAFSSATPMNLMKRTDLANTGLLSSSGAWTSLGTGPGDISAFPGFANGVVYLLELTMQRTGPSALAITVSWLNTGNGARLTTAVTDPAASNFRFDGLALRPSSAASSAANITFREVKIEFTPGSTPPAIDTQPENQSVYAGESTQFNVIASGTAPLYYQWYHQTNMPLPGATNATLQIDEVQLTDAGAYTVVVTNAYGSVTSEVAQLTVTMPVAPSISVQPRSQIVVPGQSVVFTVIAGGSEPLHYQWYYNTNTPLPGATEASLTLNQVQADDAGSYSVYISNLAGDIASDYAFLELDTNPVAPVFVTQPLSQTVFAGNNASFAVDVAGTAPISFQWHKNGQPIAGATGATLTLTNAQAADAGSYTITASNSVGTVTSAAAMLTVTVMVPVPDSAFNLVGFAQATTGGGVVPETNTTAWRKVYTAVDLAAVLNDKTGNIRIIEIMNDLDLGYNEIPAEAKQNSEPFRQDTTPSLHPELIASGVSKLDVQDKNNLTIFSANGAAVRHVHWNVKRCNNLILRNLKFDELWEWDEATKGDYDSKNWDFLTIGDSGACSNVWVDHCTFTKAYDGAIDIKGGSPNVTVSWCQFAGDDGAVNSNSWVRRQISALESNKTSYAMYNFLRTRGFSVEDVVAISQGHEKGLLVGATDLDPQNATFKLTLHHNWFISVWDRLPRLRSGNVHNFNIYVDDTAGLAARRLRDTRAAAMSPADQNTLNNTYNFKPFLNGSISTEGGAVLVEKSVYIDCLTPLRNNQTDPSDPQYTGKIKALDTVYRMDSTTIRGNSTDPGNPLGPFQAPVIEFSWNLPGNQLPYSYAMDDPSELEAIVTSPASGAGAGVLTWAKTNWLLTAYAPAAPIIIVEPVDQAADPGDGATFAVVAGGSTPLTYQWYFNTNTPIAHATNSVLALTQIQATNAGTYSVVVSNVAGTAASRPALLTVSGGLTGFEAWQAVHFTPEQLTNAAISGPSAAPAGDSVANLVKYALGLLPFEMAPRQLVQFRIENGEGILTYARPAGSTDVVYRVEISTNLPAWSDAGVTHQLTGTNGLGLQVWEGTYTGAPSHTRFFRLLMEYLP